MILGILIAVAATLSVNGQKICDKCGVDNESGRIVGGMETLKNRYPWAALITNGGDYWCGGSVINTQFILSAAHCIFEKGALMSTDEFSVSLGEHDRKSSSETQFQVQTFDVKEFIAHEEYDEDSVKNDIALVQVDGTIEYNYAVGPICLLDTDPSTFYNDLIDKEVKVVGWGDQKSGSGLGSDVLREVSLRVVSLRRCMRSYEGLSSNQICAFAEGKDSCQGDSGGPLTYWNSESGFYTQVGIVSFGEGCGGSDPGVYTFVPAYAGWIRKNVEQDYCVAI